MALILFGIRQSSAGSFASPASLVNISPKNTVVTLFTFIFHALPLCVYFLCDADALSGACTESYSNSLYFLSLELSLQGIANSGLLVNAC